MECFKYYLPIAIPKGDEPFGLNFIITDKAASKIIGSNGLNIRKLRKTYDVDLRINGSKYDKERELTINGNDRFKVYQQVLQYI